MELAALPPLHPAPRLLAPGPLMGPPPSANGTPSHTLSQRSGLFGSSCSLARVSEELRSYSDFQIHTLAAEHPSLLGRFTLDPQLLCSSAKFRALERILRELQAAGSRPLIFSQWTTCLDLIGCLMDHMGLSYLRLDGSTEVKDRLELCDQFNDPGHGVFAFMLSTRAGGQGLNLTGADTVIIHDVDFNPQAWQAAMEGPWARGAWGARGMGEQRGRADRKRTRGVMEGGKR